MVLYTTDDGIWEADVLELAEKIYVAYLAQSRLNSTLDCAFQAIQEAETFYKAWLEKYPPEVKEKKDE